MKPSFVSPTIQALDDTRLNELFVLQRIRAQIGLLRRQQHDSLDRLHGLRLKRAWEIRRLMAEAKQ